MLQPNSRQCIYFKQRWFIWYTYFSGGPLNITYLESLDDEYIDSGAGSFVTGNENKALKMHVKTVKMHLKPNFMYEFP